MGRAQLLDSVAGALALIGNVTKALGDDLRENETIVEAVIRLRRERDHLQRTAVDLVDEVRRLRAESHQEPPHAGADTGLTLAGGTLGVGGEP